jgi:glutamine synthetase
MGTLRNRCIPARRFSMASDRSYPPSAQGTKHLQADNLRFGISRGNLGTLQNDTTTTVCNPVGQIYVRSDMDTLRRMYQGNSMLPNQTATVMASFEEADGSAVILCPRGLLAGVVSSLQTQFALTFLVGFEIEITFCRRKPGTSEYPFEPLDDHAWSTFTDRQYLDSYPLIMAIANALEDIGILIEQTHSESGAGQYEFVLPPLSPVQAVDTLVQARQCIQQVAATNGLRATCHAQPFPGIGTACHANISFHAAAATEDLEKQQMHSMAFVLAHLPGLCAFTMSEAVSYARVADDSWTSGSWVAWGTQNRETPLRRTATPDGSSARWEVRCLDSMGNMYLALYAIMRAGLQGLIDGTEMTLRDCQSKCIVLRSQVSQHATKCVTGNPSRLSEAERSELGIVSRLPRTIEQSLESLQGDNALQDALGTQVVTHFVTMKKAEQEMLNAMSESERRIWLMEHY